jgi:hypothetical protein
MVVVKMNIDEFGLKECIESFERVEQIESIIIVGVDGGIRRITFEEDETK